MPNLFNVTISQAIDYVLAVESQWRNSAIEVYGESEMEIPRVVGTGWEFESGNAKPCSDDDEPLYVVIVTNNNNWAVWREPDGRIYGEC